MEKRWILREPPEEKVVEGLMKAIHVNPVLTSILVQRGYSTFESSKAYFRPSLNQLHDPFLMKDMETAVLRLESAIRDEEKILVYGDYDVDGTTAVALVYGFLKEYSSARIDLYLPDRYSEGYGISEKGINYAIENSISLIIALDCGIRAQTMIDLARTAGIDTIVCDHHLPDEILPPAYAILDPKQKGCEYPFKELCGCGIGFKLMQAYCRKGNVEEERLQSYLDLVAVSIAADIVPMVGENRILTFHGLKVLNDSPSPGLKALIKKAGLGTEIDISGIVFGIAPRINAAGRIHHANDAVWLLLANNEEKATELSVTVQDQNTERKNIDQEITAEALDMINDDPWFGSAKSTVVFNAKWHKGVVGIVASRLIEKHYKPTVVLTESNGVATGSARSVRGFNIYEAIDQCSDLLDQFGGHAYAAGLTLPVENVKKFQKRFNEVVSHAITHEQLTPHLVIDQKLKFDRINHKFFNILKQMAPFGPENPSPLFLSEDVTCSNSKVLKDAHLKLWLRQKGIKKTMEAVAFQMADRYEKISYGKPFHVVYHIESNEFNGEKSIQLVIKDIKFNKEHGFDFKG